MLPLSSIQVTRNLGLFGKPHKLEKLGGLFPCLGLGHALKLERKAHVFKAVFLHEQIKALKNHGYFSSCLPELLFSEAAHVDAVENNISRRWPFKHIYASHEGAFPGAAHADYAVDLAVVYGQRDVLKRLDLSRRKGKGLGQIFYFNHFFTSSAENRPIQQLVPW